MCLPSKSKHDIEEKVEECTGDLLGLDTGDQHVGECAGESEEDPHV